MFALSFTETGAIEYFSENLPVKAIGTLDNSLGLKEFYGTLLNYFNVTKVSPIDPIGFRSWLETETDLYAAINELIGIEAFMDTILKLKVSNPEQVSAILKSRANKKTQIDALGELSTLLRAENNPNNDEKVRELTAKIHQLQTSVGYSPLEGLVTTQDIKNNLEDVFDIPDFLTTPYRSLNAALSYSADNGGLPRGAVTAVTATSGSGKSTLVKGLCNHWLDQGLNVLFINYEETRNHWEKILLSQVIGKNVYAHYEHWSEDERAMYREQFEAKLDEWGDCLKVRHSPDSSYYHDLERWLRDIINDGTWMPDVVVIDTIQSLITKSGGPRWGDYETIMINLERLAKDFDAAFIITAQQNNDRVKENREIVKQSDIGGGVTIVQKSSIIIAITEPALAGHNAPRDDNKILMQLQIPKNRITGRMVISNMPTILYDDDSKSYVEHIPTANELELVSTYQEMLETI